VLGCDLEVQAPGGAGGGQHTPRRPRPHPPEPLPLGVVAQHRGGGVLCLGGVVRAADALALYDLDAWIVLLHGGAEAVVALLGDEEVGIVVDNADLSLATERSGHEVRGYDTVAVIVRGNR